MSDTPETETDEATGPDTNPEADSFTRALDSIAAMGDRLMMTPNRATRRAMKRAKRKKGK